MYLALLFVLYHAHSGLALNFVHRSEKKPQASCAQQHPLWNTSCGLPRGSLLPDDVVQYTAMSYAKAGIELMWKLMEVLAKNVHMPCQHCYMCHDGNVCTPNTVTHYDYSPQFHVGNLLQCPGIRTVHLVRRPTSMLVSDYLYTKNGTFWGKEYYRHKLRKVLAKLSLSKGIKFMCTSVRTRVMPMVKTVEALNNSQKTLMLKIEQFADDFDATTLSIWEHFLGRNPQALLPAKFVNESSAYDFNRHHDLKTRGKFANMNLTGEVTKEMKNLKDDECVKKLMEADKILGYTEHEHLFFDLPEDLL